MLVQLVATICSCAALCCASTSFYELRCFLLVILHKSYHSFTHELRCASKNTLCVFTIWVILARYNQSQKTRRCCRRSNTSPLKILNCIEQINNTLEPHYNADVGVHKKSMLYQNSVIMRVLYTESIGSGSQTLTVL